MPPVDPVDRRASRHATQRRAAMQESNHEPAPEALNRLGHLSSGVGHHVINAFSAIVSNAELLRIKLGKSSQSIDPAVMADMIINTALEAASVARRLIDYTRPIT